MKEEKPNINLEKIKKIALIVLGLVLIINIIFSASITQEYNKKSKEAKDASRPADISLTVINVDCKDCKDINEVVDIIKKANVNIKEETALTQTEASDLIVKYGIQKLPSVIIIGETDKVKITGFEQKDDALVFNAQLPPYFDLKTNNIVGLVELTLITDPSCSECTDLADSIVGLKQAMTVSKENIFTRTQASSLISKYNITKLPSIILSKDASAYVDIVSAWNLYGTIEEDGSLVFRNVLPPYKDLKTNTVKGIVKLTSITDNTCKECYNVSTHELILDRYGVYVKDKEIVDLTEAKSLIDKYKIEKVPTIVLTGDVETYTSLTQVWKQVGSVETDGTYVFRSVEQMGKYRDLKTGQVA